jgi:hypothetical protein
MNYLSESLFSKRKTVENFDCQPKLLFPHIVYPVVKNFPQHRNGGVLFCFLVVWWFGAIVFEGNLQNNS